MQNTRSIAPTIHDCPISHINPDAPQLYGYQSYFTLNDNPMGERGNEGEHSMPMMLYFANGRGTQDIVKFLGADFGKDM